jgi:hypothetical protein
MGPSDQDSDRGNIPRHLSDHFILDILMEVGTIQSELHLREYDKLEPRPGRDDQDLLSPYKTAKSNAVLSLDAGFKAFHNELDLIEQHVRAVRRKWQTVGSRSQKQSRVKKQGKDPYHELAEQFAAKVPGIIFTVNADKVKASFAYSLGAKFGFCMAFKLLCAIKAEANVKGNVPLLQSFGDVMTIPSSALRALAQNHDDF